MLSVILTEERGILNISENLRRLMTARNMTQMDLAQKARISQPSVHRMLAGKGNPNAIDLRNVAEVLGTTSDALMDNPKENNSKKTA